MTSGWLEPKRPCRPTPQALLRDTALTLLSSAGGAGNGTGVQLVPSQCSMLGAAVGPLAAAQASVAESALMPLTEVPLTVSSGGRVAWLQAVPFQCRIT